MNDVSYPPPRSQLICLLQSANCQFANFLNLEKGLFVLLTYDTQLKDMKSAKVSSTLIVCGWLNAYKQDY